MDQNGKVFFSPQTPLGFVGSHQNPPTLRHSDRELAQIHRLKDPQGTQSPKTVTEACR